MSYQASYTKDCDFCGRPIRLKQMPPYGQWVAFDLDDEGHDCSKVKTLSLPRVHPSDIKQPKAKPYAALPFEDFELRLPDENQEGSLAHDHPDAATEAPAGSSRDVDSTLAVVNDEVVQRIAAAIIGYPSTDFRMSAHAFWKLFDYPRRMAHLAFPIIHALRELGVEMRIISPQAGNEQIGYWVSLRSAAGVSAGQRSFLMNITSLPKPRPVPASASLLTQARPDDQVRQSEDSLASAKRELPMPDPDLKIELDAEGVTVTPLPMGRVLRLLRLRDKLTLDDLAARADISASHLSRLERNETSPSFAVIVALTRELGVTIEELEALRRSPGDLLNVMDEPPRKQEFGQLIRERRQELGLTLETVADDAGISPSHLSRLERGRTKPSFTVVGAIARVLQLDADDIVAYEREVEEVGRSFLGNLSNRIRRSLDSAPTPDDIKDDDELDELDASDDEMRILDEVEVALPAVILADDREPDEILREGINSLRETIQSSSSSVVEMRSSDLWQSLGVSRRTMRNIRRVTVALAEAELKVTTSGAALGMEPLNDVVTISEVQLDPATSLTSEVEVLRPASTPISPESGDLVTSSTDPDEPTRFMREIRARFCSRCGMSLAVGARYCHHCGQQVPTIYRDESQLTYDDMRAVWISKSQTSFGKRSVDAIPRWVESINNPRLTFFRGKEDYIKIDGITHLRWYYAPHYLTFFLLVHNDRDLTTLTSYLSDPKSINPRGKGGAIKFRVHHESDLDVIKAIIIARISTLPVSSVADRGDATMAPDSDIALGTERPSTEERSKGRRWRRIFRRT